LSWKGAIERVEAQVSIKPILTLKIRIERKERKKEIKIINTILQEYLKFRCMLEDFLIVDCVQGAFLNEN